MSKKASPQTWWEKLRGITKKDQRYTLQAYQFVFEALDYTTQKMGKDLSSPKEEERHVTGQQLLEGIKEFTLKEFGYMASPVLELWGIRCCEDFGEIVFNLVETGLMGKTASDSREDFKGGFDFKTAFDDEFQIKGKFNVTFKWEPSRTKYR